MLKHHGIDVYKDVEDRTRESHDVCKAVADRTRDSHVDRITSEDTCNVTEIRRVTPCSSTHLARRIHNARAAYEFLEEKMGRRTVEDSEAFYASWSPYRIRSTHVIWIPHGAIPRPDIIVVDGIAGTRYLYQFRGGMKTSRDAAAQLDDGDAYTATSAALVPEAGGWGAVGGGEGGDKVLVGLASRFVSRLLYHGKYGQCV
eukprot:g20436.t1